MGRKGSLLVPFLRKALKGNIYGSLLVYDNETLDTFRITLARKSDSLDDGSVRILQDWNEGKGRKLRCLHFYSEAKQGLLMALKRSDYLEFISRKGSHLTYRFLSDKEVEGKKKTRTKKCDLAHCSGCCSPLNPSSDSSSNHSESMSESSFESEFAITCIQDHFTSEATEMQLTLLDSCTITDEHAKLVNDHQWTGVEKYLMDESLGYDSRGKEVQLFRYKYEISDALIICELENEHYRLPSDSVFLEGYPGVLADAYLLQRLLSCHVEVKKSVVTSYASS